MIEEWRPIDGYEGVYEVSNMGEVMSCKFGQVVFLKELTAPKGVNRASYYDLRHNGVKNRVATKKLVAEAFIPNPNFYTKVRNIDGDKRNNCASNLEWYE